MLSRLKLFSLLELCVCRALLCLLSCRLMLKVDGVFCDPGKLLVDWDGVLNFSGDLDSDLE